MLSLPEESHGVCKRSATKLGLKVLGFACKESGGEAALAAAMTRNGPVLMERIARASNPRDLKSG
jgi:hypothetical protein